MKTIFSKLSAVSVWLFIVIFLLSSIEAIFGYQMVSAKIYLNSMLIVLYYGLIYVIVVSLKQNNKQ
jgi:hypothetical protein